MLDLFIVANAAGTGLGEGIANAIYEIADQLLPIATAIAVVGVIICGIKLLMASDPSSVKMAKSWLIAIVIGYGIIILARTLVPMLGNVFNVVKNTNGTK